MMRGDLLAECHSLPRKERELLLAHALSTDRVSILAHPEYTVPLGAVRRYRAFIRRRAAHEPIAYITGEKEFFGRSFLVNRHTLIPRPETELLVERALAIQKAWSRTKHRIAVIDIGTGSGCIIVSLAALSASAPGKRRSPIRSIAIDRSARALSIARENARRHGVARIIRFHKGDLLGKTEAFLDRCDAVLIVANLPYLSEKLYRAASEGVRRYEPQMALVSGPDGLLHYRRLLRSLSRLSNGRTVNFLLEISPEQAESISRLIRRELPACHFSIQSDLAGKKRLVIGSLEATKNPA
jgi:release factor glutamine methyltransferase